MGKKVVTPDNLQVVAGTCIWIASKFNEICPPSLNSFVDILSMTDWNPSYDDLVNLECDILNALNFELAKPTVKTFLMDKSYDADISREVDNTLFEISEKLPSQRATEIRKRKRNLEEDAMSAKMSRVCVDIC